MSKYLKAFETTTEYNTYITGNDKILPNVSLCEDNYEVHYNPIQYICKLTLSDSSVVNIEGSGELTQAMISSYSSTCVSAEIGVSCTNIGDSAFDTFTNLTSITMPSSVTSIGNAAFYGCSGLTSIVIPNSVTSIGEDTFSGCSGLTNVTIGSGVTSIGIYAFYGCSGLTSIVIPNSVTSIGSEVFEFCSGLTSVTIGNSVTSIGIYAFNNCSGLASITSLATTAPTIDSTTFNNVKTNGTLYVPYGSSGYDTWMGTGNYYLGKYNWTKVEQ